jgi:membrane fusion protein, multidrug efflux system
MDRTVGSPLKKNFLWVMAGLLLIIASLAASKALQIGALIKHGKEFVPPPATVTVAEVKLETWQQNLNAVGNLTAVEGTTIAAELPGKVVQIAFEAGVAVRKGDLLVRQDTSIEQAQLPGTQAAAELTRINRVRADTMFADKIISQTDHDTAVANDEQARAQVNSLRATIEKKTLRVPFSGRLGVRQVSVGQLLQGGDPIVTLQALDPIFVNFSLPQQELAQVKVGQQLRVTCDALPGRTVQGKVTAISPLVDSDTRNIQLQATVENHGEALRPGMYVNVSVDRPVRLPVQIIPATAVLYAPYSDSVFVIDPAGDGKGKVLRQQLVSLGEKRGDLVAVSTGLKPGETVVTTGVFKLRNGQPAVIDNTGAPAFQQSPRPENN